MNPRTVETMSFEAMETEKATWMKKINSIPGIGLIMGMLSGIFLATGSLTVKLVHSLSGIEVAIARSLVTAVVTLLIVAFNRERWIPPVGEKWPLFIRAFTGCLALLLSYSSLKLIPLGDSQSIVFSSPVLVTIWGCLLLKEPCGFIQVFALIAVMVGIFLISQPSFLFPASIAVSSSSGLSDHTIGLIMALGSCLFASCTFVCMRRLPKTPASIVVFWYSSFCTVAGLIVSFVNGSFKLPDSTGDYLLLLVCGLTGLAGQGILTLALKVEHAGPVSLARSIEIVMAFIYQVSVLHEPLSMYSLLGAFILGLGVIAVGLHKWYLSDPQRFKRIFCCES
ncbi:solute carrier family 35 member G1 [Tetranychus urticae]|uniref:EamA domain-containing protein n=1 Tax=Tetranychus urticae TaxID=32264 RepID=T1KIB2_TETUR|nr:solute carrier family 35 member G1 [Tetranychus urticae]XP_025017089.1 solute carrier family 35 member G1 [Tetranychus urticae]